MSALKSNAAGLLKIITILQPVRNTGKYIYKPLIPENYPVEYKRPIKTPCYTPQKSGDLGFKIDVSPNDYMLYCETSKELEDANEIVKKMFTLHFNRKSETVKLMKEKLTRDIQRHKYDTTSPEVRIGIMTLKINLFQEYLNTYQHDGRQIKVTKELIEKRNKHLKLIREIDYKLYEWLLEKLNLIFRAPLEDVYEQVTKKGTIRALTDKLCKKIIQDKLDAYKAELDQEKKTFFKDKLEKLIYIKEQEIKLGLEPTVTEEDIIKAEEDVKKY